MSSLEFATRALRVTLVTVSAANFYDDAEREQELRKNVCPLVRELKATGMAPEHVLLTVKQIAREAGIDAARTPLVGRMVRWCLEEYFAT